jgi:F-type H+-transporting ATPase subunit epsilon
MSGKFTFSIATPDGPVAGGPCEFLVIPTTAGEVGVMAGHAALVACVAPGELRVTRDGAVQSFPVGGGLVDVRDDEVRLLVSTAEKNATGDRGRPASS